jgi:hypothetical protein
MYFLVDDEVISYLAEKKLMGDSNAIREYRMGQPLLYAITSKKKIAKKFEETRNQKVFYKDVVELDNDGEFAIETGASIEMCELYIGGKSTITLPLTENESWILSMSSETMLDFMSSSKLPNYRIFSNEIQSLLGLISYAYCSSDREDNVPLPTDDEYDDFSMKEFRNEFAVFMLIFNKLINTEGCLKVGELNKNEG